MDRVQLRRVFPGDSEMAAVMRQFAWDETPLGTPDTWPENLRTAVSICLSSRTPKHILWGTEHLMLYNDAYAKFIGPDRHPSVLARSGRDAWGEAWDHVGPRVERVRETGEPGTCEVPHDEDLVVLTLSPIFDADRVAGVYCATVDITERRSKDDFLSLLGHELRNPLSTVLTTLQVLQRQQPSSEVQLMDRAVRHLTRLVDDLLDMSRLRLDKIALRRTHVELAEVIDLALERVRPQLEECRTRVLVCAPRTSMRLDCDPERIAQVLANVVSNGAKFSEPGDEITIEASRAGNSLRIVVKDRGLGIDARNQQRVFDSFREHGDVAGLGLGLAISRKLVALHGGTIALQSRDGDRGAECTIELPCESPATPTELPKKPRKRVLLVEDNHDTAIALQRALESLGYAVALAHNGPVALTVARSFHPDVALLDINLPVMDGWELSRRLRELEVPARKLRFVAVTARDQEQDKQRSEEAGFADHLVKPIDLSKLERVVENLPDPSVVR